MTRRHASLFFLVPLVSILGAPVPVPAQEESPESLGLSSDRLERVAELMQRHIAEATFSGAVTLVARDNLGEGYGLGVRVVTDPAARNTLLSRGSFGWSGAFNTHFFIDPEERLVGLFMTQSAFLETRQQLRDDFETAVMQALVDDAD